MRRAKGKIHKETKGEKSKEIFFGKFYYYINIYNNFIVISKLHEYRS